MSQITKELIYTVQFYHPEKIISQMPGINNDETRAALLGVEVDLYRQLRERFTLNAQQTAKTLLNNPHFCRLVDRLPFAPGATVVGLGDSITDDSQSWLEILRHLLYLRRPSDSIKVINAGISGDTTTHLISRFMEVAQQQPDWIICLAGTNDVRRHGLPPTQVLVSLEETAKNLQMLRHLMTSQTQARWVWMTPPTVIEAQIEADWALAPLQERWFNQDLAQVSAVVRQLPDPVIDLQKIFGIPAHPDLLLADGLHPSLAGHQVIVSALVEKLAEIQN
ncbi:MAG: GDSL-type esterase/lipase family protein [Microcoleaceae cyanobacterium]